MSLPRARKRWALSIMAQRLSTEARRVAGLPLSAWIG